MNTATQVPADWYGMEVTDDRTFPITDSMAAEMRTRRYHRGDFRQAMGAAAYASNRGGGKPMFVFATANGFSVQETCPVLPLWQSAVCVICDGSTVRRVRLARNA